jgi:diamine N-acetyltransferase
MISLTRGTPDDITLVMSAERQPDYEWSVGRWTEAQHRGALASPDCIYLIGGRTGEAPQGFAILRELDQPYGNVCLKRIAVLEAGRGFGQAFMEAVMDWVFTQTQTHRFWLDVIEQNVRGRHVYTKLGFVEEGRKRDAHILPNGTRTSYRLMSILRPEWHSRTKS